MSKRKQLHNIKTPVQMLQHSRRNAIGPLYHWEPTKKTAASASNTDDGKETTHRPLNNTKSAPIVAGTGKGSQA